jgi:hypothetical protein
MVIPQLALLLRLQWEQAISREMVTGQATPWDRGTNKSMHPKGSIGDGRKHARWPGCPNGFPLTSGGPPSEI